MTDIKRVIALLCKCLNLSIDSTLKPEYFRLAKYNNAGENVVRTLWTVLHALSSCAAKENQCGIDFKHYGTVLATKLYLSYLQYPVLQFYCLTGVDQSSRQLLLAIAWLLETQKVLNITVRLKLINSILGKECTHTDERIETFSHADEYQLISTELNSILCLSNKVNHNIKEISELVSERIKLITKIHAASMNTSGLQHLHLSEITLFKNFVQNDSNVEKHTHNAVDTDKLQQLCTVANLLDAHMKFIEKEQVFFDWMVTVIQEHKSNTSNMKETEPNEISNFTPLLHYITKQRLETVDNNGIFDVSNLDATCPSRLLRTEGVNTEAEKWSAEVNKYLIQVEEELQNVQEKLSTELNESSNRYYLT